MIKSNFFLNEKRLSMILEQQSSKEEILGGGKFLHFD